MGVHSILACADVQVDTVKRMCIKNLPQVLVIQLKRFDYDWERSVSTPDSSHFPFPPLSLREMEGMKTCEI